jgi:hypothetical protein
MNIGRFLLPLFFFAAIAFILIPTHTTATQPGTIWTWCVSDPSYPTVYFTRPFDSGMSARPKVFNGLSLGRQFSEYLKGRFDTKGDASCGHGVNGVDQAAAFQRIQEFEAQMRQQHKQIVEVTDWNYVRDEIAIKASFSTPTAQGAYIDVEGGLPADHIYCIAGPSNNTIYYAEPIALTNPSLNPSIGYFKFLQQKYSFKGDSRCPILNEPHAKLYLNAQLAGARAGGKQIVNTGWPAVSSTPTAQVPNDRYQDNDQPAQRPAAQKSAPSVQVRDLASKEVSSALSFCHNNRAMNEGYNCACLQVKIYDYRIAHPSETLNGMPALTSLFDGKLPDSDKCINESMAKLRARDEAKVAGLKLPAAQQCVGEKFVALLHAKPIPLQAQSELDAAIKACRQ